MRTIVLALVIGAILSLGAPAVLLTAAEPGSYVLDPNAVIQGQNQLITDHQPYWMASGWNGIVLHDYLGANRFYAAGITGQQTIAANVEAGYIWGGAGGQDALQNVTTYIKGSGAAGEIDQHATEVGLIIGGRHGSSPTTPAERIGGDWQLGIAYGTDLRSGAVATRWFSESTAKYSLKFDLTTTSLITAYNAFFGTADVVNSSWGLDDDSTGTGGYTVALDGFVRANPRTTFVASAGNATTATNPSNNVTAIGSGYNVITVGALKYDDTIRGYQTIADNSSRGPQDYGEPGRTVARSRAVVDLVAPGDRIFSAFYGGQTGGNGASLSSTDSTLLKETWRYAKDVAGSSFSSAIVAGGVALLDSASKAGSLDPNSRDTRVIRAVLMNSADKLPGWNNGQTSVGGVITTTQALDWTLGAGRVNFDRAYDQYLSGTRGVSGLAGGTISALGWDFKELSGVGAQNDYVFDTPLRAGEMLDVTLSWLRNRTVNATGYTSADVGFANLDLEVWDSTFTNLIATSSSHYDSVEHLHFALPQDGAYGLRVRYTGQQFGTATAESYAVAWAVPEPGSFALLAAVAVLLAGWCGWRRARSRTTGSPHAAWAVDGKRPKNSSCN